MNESNVLALSTFTHRTASPDGDVQLRERERGGERRPGARGSGQLNALLGLRDATSGRGGRCGEEEQRMERHGAV